MKRKKLKSQILFNRQLAPDIYDMVLEGMDFPVKPGQFVMVYPESASNLLPRPISICAADTEDGFIRLVYRVAGQGTEEFSRLKPGAVVDILGPLGNGFPVEAAQPPEVETILLMGGGIGIPPILGLAKSLSDSYGLKGNKEKDPDAEKSSERESDGSVTKSSKRIIAALGYRNNSLFLMNEIARFADVMVATEDGSVGKKGNVLDVIASAGIRPDLIYACGPLPMLRAIKEYKEKLMADTSRKSAPLQAYISLEERMACGVGACLGCVVKTKERDSHSMVNNARICTEGPVFEASVVDI